MGDEDLKIGLLAVSLGAVIELLREARTAISDQWDGDHPATIDLLDRMDAFLGPTKDVGRQLWLTQ